MSYISLINMLQYRYSNMLPLLREWTAGIDPVQINELAFCIIIFFVCKDIDIAVVDNIILLFWSYNIGI